MHVVCWDLDETLGQFRGLGGELYERMLLRLPGLRGTFHRLRRAIRGAPEPAEITVRDGIAEVLGALDDAGVVQVVTTASYRRYADLCLQRAGLATRFSRVFARKDLLGPGVESKRYQPVLDRLGCTPAELLIVGDAYQRDRADDYPRIPMIVQPHGWKESAAPLLPLIEALRREPTFLAGWERLFAEATKVGRKRRVILDDGVCATIDRWGPARPEPTPVLVELSGAVQPPVEFS